MEALFLGRRNNKGTQEVWLVYRKSILAFFYINIYMYTSHINVAQYIYSVMCINIFSFSVLYVRISQGCTSHFSTGIWQNWTGLIVFQVTEKKRIREIFYKVM